MIKNIHTLDAIRDHDFLSENRKDPVTGQILRANDQIVICSNDKIAFVHDTWLEGCPICGNERTLEIIPVSSAPIRITRGVITDSHDYGIGQQERSGFYSSDNPFARLFGGLGFALLIYLQYLTLLHLILTLLFHPILSISKALKIIISNILLVIMIPLAVTWDILMCLLWLISLGYIKTSRLIVIGYTKGLYKWITNNGTYWSLR